MFSHNIIWRRQRDFGGMVLLSFGACNMYDFHLPSGWFSHTPFGVVAFLSFTIVVSYNMFNFYEPRWEVDVFALCNISSMIVVLFILIV